MENLDLIIKDDTRVSQYSGLIKINTVAKAAELLTPEQRDIIRASEFIPVKDQTVDEVTALSSSIYKAAKIRLQHNKTDLSEKEVEAMQKEILYDLTKQFALYTKEELLLAVKAGCNGEFDNEGAVIFFSPANFVKWVHAYKRKKKQPAMLAYLKALENTTTLSLPPASAETINKAGILEYYEILKNNRAYHSAAQIEIMYYNYLERVGTLELDPEAKREIYEIIREQAVEEFNEAKRGLIGKVGAVIAEKNKYETLNKAVPNRCKIMAFRLYLLECIDNKKDPLTNQPLENECT